MDFLHVVELDVFFKNHRYPVQLEDILAKFGYSRSTFHQIRKHMCEVHGAPIKNKRGRGYYYDLSQGETFELPGIWFNAKEIMALVLLEQISTSLQPNTFNAILSPINQRLDALLRQHNIEKQHWHDRLKIVTQWQRDCEPAYFINITQALLGRKQLFIHYWKWVEDKTSERTISPQRIVYYRNNWYLDAWCHSSQAIKTFSINGIKHVQLSEQPAHEIDIDELNQHVTAGYGIFSGQANHIAKLKFTGAISKRVSLENWHPDQESYWTSKEEYILKVPYSRPEELIRDILSYGIDVEVIRPNSLKQAVIEKLQKTLKKYC